MKTATLDSLDIYKIGSTIQMVGSVYAGEGKAYLCLFPNESADHEIIHLKMSREDWEKFHRQTDLLETEVITKASDGKLAKTVIRKSQRQIDAEVSWSVWRRDGTRCRYCHAGDVALTVDHLVTYESGGPSIPCNLVSACKRCNRERGNMEYAAWLSSKEYAHCSARLPVWVKQANDDLVPTLDTIPRLVHKRSR